MTPRPTMTIFMGIPPFDVIPCIPADPSRQKMIENALKTTERNLFRPDDDVICTLPQAVGTARRF